MPTTTLTWHQLLDFGDNWELRQTDGTWAASIWRGNGPDSKLWLCEKLGCPVVTEHVTLAAAKRYAWSP